jgi:hypothetical protein
VVRVLQVLRACEVPQDQQALLERWDHKAIPDVLQEKLVVQVLRDQKVKLELPEHRVRLV